MSRQKLWTEGEWRVIKKPRPVGYANYEIAWSDDGELVCDVVYEEADAQVMAAAKDLADEHEAWAANFGAALIDVLQGDYELIETLARNTQIEFTDGGPRIASPAIDKAYGEDQS